MNFEKFFNLQLVKDETPPQACSYEFCKNKIKNTYFRENLRSAASNDIIIAVLLQNLLFIKMENKRITKMSMYLLNIFNKSKDDHNTILACLDTIRRVFSKKRWFFKKYFPLLFSTRPLLFNDTKFIKFF